MQKEEFTRLAAKISDGTATDREIALYNAWFNTYQQKEAGEVPPVGEALYRRIERQTRSAKVRRLWVRIAAAASIVLALGIGGLLIVHQKQPKQQLAEAHDLQPGTNKATLTLADGSKIVLDQSKQGQIALQGKTQIQKRGELLTYKAGVNSAQAVAYNTLTTKAGEQFSLVLADGTKVWLNAASSLRYPVNFNGDIRQVELTGEAYFEVVHNAARPFNVLANGIRVEDIGTSFDVNAYSDEPVIRTTLVEGSVKVSKGTASAMLKPGQAAATSGETIRVGEGDMASVTGWKNGLFHFNHAGLDEVMRQLARWYNVKVEYEGEVPRTTINGEIYRNMTASKVFEGLSYLKVKFRIEGDKIIVSNK
jgi:ferric-dicitrate binding protein FerR (iron transport regulator)